MLLETALCGTGTLVGALIGFIIKQKVHSLQLKRKDKEIEDWEARYKKRESTWMGEIGNRSQSRQKQEWADLCKELGRTLEGKELSEAVPKVLSQILKNPTGQEKIGRMINKLPKLMDKLSKEEKEPEESDSED